MAKAGIVVAVVFGVAGSMAWSSVPAGAATSRNCTGSASSSDDQGGHLDSVAVPGPQGTAADPFRIFWGEPITWAAQTDQPVTGGTWQLTVQHPSWLFAFGEFATGHVHGLDGAFTDGLGATSFTGGVTPSDIEPVTLPGRYDIAVTVTGPGQVSCTAWLSVRVMDPPGRNPLFWLAALLVIAGLVLLIVCGLTKVTRPDFVRSNSPRRTS